MRALLFSIAAVAALGVTAGSAAASVDPSLTVRPQKLTLGETATIRGLSWVVDAGCDARVRVRIKGSDRSGSAWSASVGSARVKRSTGAFRLRFTPPQSKFPTGRATLVATQRCPADQGGDLVRRTKLRLVD